MKDYAHKSTHAKTHNTGSRTGIVAVMISSTILFSAFSAYHFLHQKMASTHASKASHPTPKTKILVKKAKKPAHLAVHKQSFTTINPADIQPKYDFYRILPEMKVHVS